MAAVGAGNESELQAAVVALEPAAAAADARPLPTLDPRLLMVARRGDSKALKDLLQLNDDDQQVQGTRTDDGGSGTPTTAAAATTTTTTTTSHVIVEVEPRRHDAVAALLPPPPAPPVLVLDGDGVTTEEGYHSEIVEQVVVEPPPPHDDVSPPVRQPSAAAPAGSFPAAVPVLDEDEATTEEGSLLVDSEIVEQVVVEPPLPHDDAAPPAGQPPAAGPAGSFLAAVPVLDEDGVTMDGDSLLHVVAACGDTQEFLDCAKMIVRNKEKKGGAGAKRRALEARNNKGDTPLHCAARAGNVKMIACLAALITTTTDDDNEEARAAVKKAFLRMQNGCGETALHQAVRAAASNMERQRPAVLFQNLLQLMNMDRELACIPHEDGASPLYLAISLGEFGIARDLYRHSNGKLSYSGPDGRNVLHAAVYFDQGLKMILKWIKDTKPKEDSSSASLVPHLTSQRDRKHKGSTPLHLAASLWNCQTAELLLDANESTAYQADDEGSYPIHVAAWFGDSLVIVKMLLERCPDCATLQDGKGRTFLHVATEKKSLDVVRYVVSGEMPQRWSSMILNAQDSNGDTALHGAVRAGYLPVFNCLLRNPQVRLDVANKDGMTPVDISWTMLPPGFQYAFNPRTIVHRSLRAARAPHSQGRAGLFTKIHRPKRDADVESKKYTEATQVMSIVTALIATVTFASAFTLPGGYRADGGPVHAGSYAFDAFILADTLAFICSISATCTLVYAGLPAVDSSIRLRFFVVSAVLLQSAARSLVAAFGLGLYLVVHNTASTIAACAIVFASSLYGNMEVSRITGAAKTVISRTGIRRYPIVTYYSRLIFLKLLSHFWSYIIIFGLPTIRKRVH